MFDLRKKNLPICGKTPNFWLSLRMNSKFFSNFYTFSKKISIFSYLRNENVTKIIKTIHTVRKWIYIGHKLPRTFDSSLYNIWYKCIQKMLGKINLNEEKKSCSSRWTWTCDHFGQVWSGQNQMKNVKPAANL